VSTPIEDYALIGDMRCAGLVAKSGSIDWLCLPRFDAPACFAALLGTHEHGRWLIAPRDEDATVTRSYRDETLVLETTFETETGIVVLVDCLSLDSEHENVQLVRIVQGLRGSVAMHTALTVRFDYGTIVPWVTRDGQVYRFVGGPHMLRLHTELHLAGQGLHTVGEFEVAAGQSVSFVASYQASHRKPLPLVAADAAVQATEQHWHAWSMRSSYKGRYRDAVQRSLVVLKALTYEPTGGIIAAPTTSLPEHPGGMRNWDYRFCWLRDATVALYALLMSGYQDEAIAWRDWLARAVAGSPEQVQVMYGIAGERRLNELELPWLPGHDDSRPVRIGNAAHTQLQLDVFGELMDAMHQCRSHGLPHSTSWSLECQLLDYLAARWREPDEGIWEVRGPRRLFTHSKVMVWVAFDRAVKAIEEFGCKGPLERYRSLRDEIHRDVCERGYSERKRSFTHWYGSEGVDASLLQIPLVGFLPADDPRVQGTVAAIERELLVDGSFVLRYRTDPNVDGLPDGEGAFLACSFWLVNNYAMQGRHAEATRLFESLLLLCNDVGLLAEEYDPRARRMRGNFPQAFSHLALVDAAHALSEPMAAKNDHRTCPLKSAATQS
jgi:GH15 family glucan-1,4-alpha-glucosidase